MYDLCSLHILQRVFKSFWNSKQAWNLCVGHKKYAITVNSASRYGIVVWWTKLSSICRTYGSSNHAATSIFAVPKHAVSSVVPSSQPPESYFVSWLERARCPCPGCLPRTPPISLGLPAGLP
mmetsp:Transcript_89712/g.239729  ORF Transcript_89712/g.239729 Transcript_89712/m.239729 type:complete len:122 (+) Transcript_89712:252-617(+)